MDKVTETWVTSPKRPTPHGDGRSCLIHIYPTGPLMGKRYPLSTRSLVLGRGEDCEVRIPDNSVSRRHARIDPAPDGYEVIDLQSTNGTFVNDAQVSTARLHDGDYLRVGNCIYRFLSGDNIEAEYHEEIYRLTIIDALTQVHNRRALLEFLERELVRSARHHRPLSLIMFDLDRFKAINDEYGHLAGDFALRELSGRVRDRVRREDLLARYGGEEFVLALVETTLDGAMRVAEEMRQIISREQFRFEDRPFTVTISLGVASTCGDEKMTPDELLRLADEKLYQAKRTGRNKVVG